VFKKRFPETSFIKIVVCLLIFLASSMSTSRAQISPTTSATITGSVSDSKGNPVANARVSLSGAKVESTRTDSRGLFEFVGVPHGTYTITAYASDLGTVTEADITVQGDINVAIQYQANLKTIARVRSNANASFNITPASITQVNPTANALQGITSWRDILEQIPGIAQAGLYTGATTFAAVNEGPQVPVQISINGALPYETAILLDDMPLITGNFATLAGTGTNLGLFPLNGFGAADVVRGPGANAPSIVDSIGGSFVLHAPQPVQQNSWVLSFSNDPYGGIVANGVASFHWNKLSGTFTYGVNDSPGPTTGSVIPADTAFTPYEINGLPFSCTGSCATGYLLSPKYSPASFPYYGVSNGLLVCCVNISTAWTQHSGSGALTYQISPAVSAEVFYAGQAYQEFAGYPIYTTDFTPPAGYTGSVPAGLQLLPDNGEFLTTIPTQTSSSLVEEKFNVRVGEGNFQIAGLQDSSLVTCVLGSPTELTQRLYGGGVWNGVPTVFNGGTYRVTYGSIQEDSWFASKNRDLFGSYTTPLGNSARAGISFVASYYDTPSASRSYLGYPYFLHFTSSVPSADSQTTNEVRFFVGADPSDQTSLDLSVYSMNADYHVTNPLDATGNKYVDVPQRYTAPRLGFVWHPQPILAFRVSAGGGFAQPSLQDLIGTNFPACSAGRCFVTKPNLALKPEQSFGFDIGGDVRIRQDTIVSLDLYRTNLFGQLYTSTMPGGTYTSLPLFTTQFGNLGESRYEGILLEARHEVPRGIYWSLTGGFTRGFVVSVPAGFYNAAPAVCDFATGAGCTNINVVPDVNFNGSFTSGGGGFVGGVNIPYAQAHGIFGYRWNPSAYADVVGTYFGKNNTYFVPAFVGWDAHIGFGIHEGTSLLLTFRNFTGVYNGSTQVYSEGNLHPAPTVAGLPYPLYAEAYGPRAVIVTLLIK
jgi:hypothetical protein